MINSKMSGEGSVAVPNNPNIIRYNNQYPLQVKSSFFQRHKKLLITLFILLLLLAIIAAILVPVLKKKYKKKKIFEKNQEKLEDYSFKAEGVDCKQTTIGTVSRNSTDAYGAASYSDMSSAEGIKVSSQVQNAVKYENTPNLQVATIYDSNGNPLLKNSHQLVVDGGVVTTFDMYGNKQTFNLNSGMKVKLKDGTMIDYNQLKVMDNVRTNGTDVVLLDKKVTGTVDFDKNSVSGTFSDDLGTEYFSFDTGDISDKPIVSAIVNTVQNDYRPINNHNVAKAMVDLWVEKKTDTEVSKEWMDKVKNKDVSYKDIDNDIVESSLKSIHEDLKKSK